MFQVAICCNQSNQNGVHFILDTAPIVRNPREEEEDDDDDDDDDDEDDDDCYG